MLSATTAYLIQCHHSSAPSRLSLGAATALHVFAFGNLFSLGILQHTDSTNNKVREKCFLH
jgi:hypothetical protein